MIKKLRTVSEATDINAKPDIMSYQHTFFLLMYDFMPFSLEE